MARLRSIVVAVALLACLGAPLMACLQPMAAMTAEERECCREMANQCASLGSSHSCCKTTIGSDAPFVKSANVGVMTQSSHPLAFVQIAFATFDSASASPRSATLHSHAPPGRAADTSTILRI